LTVYFLSFLLIGVIWVGHRRIVSHLRDIDGVGPRSTCCCSAWWR
jgi:uncharacterized membrane protein